MDASRAAVIIQTRYRRYLARKIYCQRLLEKFQQDEVQRKAKEQQQVSEGEVLVKRYNLQTEITDLETLSANKQRHLNVLATRIQREWRAYKTRHSLKPQSTPNNTQECINNCSAAVPTMNGSYVKASPDPTRHAVLNNDPIINNMDKQAMESTQKEHQYHSSTESLERTRAWNSSAQSVLRSNVKLHSSNSRTPQFESKYQLCFTSDLSESSGEEQDLMTYNSQSPSNHWHMESNGHHGTVRTDSSMGPQLDEDSKMPIQLRDFILTTSGLLYSEDFNEDEWKIRNRVHSLEADTLSDSLTLKEEISPQHSHKLSPVKTVKTLCNSVHSLDHRNSPLHSKTIKELEELLKSLKSKMKVTSKDLIELLITRDELVVENTLLHQNIEKLARSSQSLYQKQLRVCAAHN